MNPSSTSPSNTALADVDLAKQARPGYGIPSQDPRPAAQLPLEPEEAEREAKSVLTGGGVMAGAATGAAIGTVVAGPVGAVVGGTLGAVAGALGGAAAGTMVNQDSSSVNTATADIVRLHNVRHDRLARTPQEGDGANAGHSRRR
jgi:non-heme chloroperoxidase